MLYSLSDAPLYPPFMKDFFGNAPHGFVLPPGFTHLVLLVIYIIFGLGYLIYTFILFYHWHTYGMKNRMIIGAEFVFMIVSAVLFLNAFMLI